ncbi:MAG: hypothetical protein WDW36_006982 [Sanguina aurantia]
MAAALRQRSAWLVPNLSCKAAGSRLGGGEPDQPQHQAQAASEAPRVISAPQPSAPQQIAGQAEADTQQAQSLGDSDMLGSAISSLSLSSLSLSVSESPADGSVLSSSGAALPNHHTTLAVPKASSAIPAGATAAGSSSGAAPNAKAPAAPKAPSAAGAAAAAAAASAAAASGPKKELTRAERRDIQEQQRLAKAQAKGPAAGGGSKAVAAEGKPSKAGAAAGSGVAGASARSAAVADGGKGRERAGSSTPVPAPGAASAPPSQGQAQGSVPAQANRLDLDRTVSPRLPTSAPRDSQQQPQQHSAPHPQQPHKATSYAANSAELFAHLQQFTPMDASVLLGHTAAAGMHPAVLQLGLLYADGSVTGANARCLAMLNTICQVIKDYKTPEGKTLCRDLLLYINSTINFLVVCRPLAVSMGNAIKWLKLRIARIKPDEPELAAKEYLLSEIHDFIESRITRADTMVVSYAVQKVVSGDVIMTFAYSHVVYQALLEAATKGGKRFSVVVVDSRPELEGRHMLERLLAAGIPCTYVYVNALSYIMREVSKVFMGAATVLPNGTVISRAGAAAVAMMAAAHSKPVMICCESYKFSERVQLDSITHNELGDPQELVAVAGRTGHVLEGWSEQPRLRLLNLKYDAMPSEYVTMIVTEFGMIPPTSVPVILREFRQLEAAQSEAGFKE